jgi:hypothetical protein
VDPRDADAVSDGRPALSVSACDDVADHLMSRYHRQSRRFETTVHDVEVSATHRTDTHANEQLVAAWCRGLDVFHRQGCC